MVKRKQGSTAGSSDMKDVCVQTDFVPELKSHALTIDKAVAVKDAERKLAGVYSGLLTYEPQEIHEPKVKFIEDKKTAPILLQADKVLQVDKIASGPSAGFNFLDKVDQKIEEVRQHEDGGSAQVVKSINFGSEAKKPSLLGKEEAVKEPTLSFKALDNKTETASSSKPVSTNETSKPSFNFGVSKDSASKPEQPSLFSKEKESSVPSFNFGGSKSAETPSFNFGAKTLASSAVPSGTTSTEKKSEAAAGFSSGVSKPEEKKDATLFGSVKPDGQKEASTFSLTSKAEEKKGTTLFNFGTKTEDKIPPTTSSTFGINPEEKKTSPPTFAFGSKPDDKKEPTPAFTFGSKPDDKKEPTPTFAFGSKPDDKKESTPTFSFASKPQESKSAFNFAATTSDKREPSPFSGGSNTSKEPTPFAFGAPQDDRKRKQSPFSVESATDGKNTGPTSLFGNAANAFNFGGSSAGNTTNEDTSQPQTKKPAAIFGATTSTGTSAFNFAGASSTSNTASAFNFGGSQPQNPASVFGQSNNNNSAFQFGGATANSSAPGSAFGGSGSVTPAFGGTPQPSMPQAQAQAPQFNTQGNVNFNFAGANTDPSSVFGTVNQDAFATSTPGASTPTPRAVQGRKIAQMRQRRR